MSPDRRAVLKGVAAGGVVVVGGGLLGWQLLADDDEPGDAAESPNRPRPPDPPASVRAALVAVGTRYLEVEPDEADRDELLAALPALDGEVPERPAEALDVLAEQAAADHEAGEVIELDGWVLSRTECRAAALYAL